MSEHLPDVELTDAQDARATALERAVIERPASAACLIVYQQDRIAELIESLRQQESQLRTALDELRQMSQPPAESPLDFARRFHEAYERLAPSFGYETRTETRVFNPNSTNGRLMVAVCAELGAAVTTDGTP